MISGALTLGFRHSDPYERRDAFKRVGVSLVMVVLTWQVAPFLIHLASQASIYFVPSGSEILGAPVENLAKLLTISPIAIVLVYFYASSVVLGLVAVMAQHVLIHLCVAMWPLAWACRAYKGTIESIGNFWIWLFGLLLGVNILQGIALRFIYVLPWDSGISGPILGLITSIIGLAFALVYLPYMALQTADRAANVGLGMSSLRGRRYRDRKSAGEYAQNASDRVGNVQEQVKQWRGGQRDEPTDSGPSAGGVPQSGAPGVSSGKGHVGTAKQRPRVGSMGGAERQTRRMERERDHIDHSNDYSDRGIH